MDKNHNGNPNDVSISVEITGRYDEVVDKLEGGAPERGDLEPVMADLAVLLDTLVELDGGTRSAIASALPDRTAVEYDAEAVVAAMQLLERYGLVRLEGNTWKPGPTFE